MRVSIALAAVCAATSAVLLLAACGGGGGAGGSDKIRRVEVGSPSASASPAVTATVSVSAGRPTIVFPSYAKNVFEDQHTGDPVRDAVLADNAQWVDSMDDAIFQGTTGAGPLMFYSAGRGTELAVAYVHAFVRKGYTWTGTVRFFDRKATLLGNGTASVVYCSDESNAFPKHRKTGKIDNVATTANSYVLYNAHLKRNPQGVWQTDNVLSDRGAKRCQP